MAFLGQEEHVRAMQDRFRFLRLGVFIGLGILISRLTYLQILMGDQMRRYSEDNRIKKVKIQSPRGMIFDRNRTLLMDNRPAFDLEITPQYLRESGQTKEVIKLLSVLINLPEKQIYEKLEKGRGQPKFLPVKIKTDLTRDEVAQVESWKIAMPGVSVEMEIQRTNIFGDIASHLLGYIGAVNATELPKLNQDGKKYEMGDSLGKVGIEKQFEDILKGVHGQELVEVDALGRRLRDTEKKRVIAQSAERPAVPGKNLILTIDQDLQLAARRAFGEKVGSLVAIDPRSGEILAMISRPSFDPTEFSRGVSAQIWKSLLDNENRPLKDKTIQDHYSPGSVFKTVTAVAGLEEGVIDENTKFRCTGSIRVGNRIYHCHKKQGHGEIGLVSALAVSCDTFFYRVAQKLRSVDDIAKWAMRLGLGSRTGIELPREVKGLIPTEEWKRKTLKQEWTAGETLSVAIGQGFVLTTTLQLANVYAAISNGGTLFKPYYVKTIESYDGQVLKEFKPTVLSKIQLHPKTVELIDQGLWGVVNSPMGTAYSQRLQGMDFSGKTGTVQVIRIAKEKIYQKCESMKYRHRHHGVFVGFAPVKDPVIAVAVISEHACHGASGAAPAAREVIKTYLEKYYPDLYSTEAIAARLKTSKDRIYKPVRAADAEPEDITPNTDDENESSIPRALNQPEDDPESP